MELIRSSFDPEYAYYLGYTDARELGTKHPYRSFEYGKSARDNAYFYGLTAGLEETRKHGLVMECLVHWDNPGFHTRACGNPGTHVATWDENRTVLTLCDRHAKQARTMDNWAVIPISWET